MTTQTARRPKRKPMSIVSQVKQEFRITYADAVIPDMTDAQWSEAERIRRLTWKSPHRLSLANAAKCYGQMATTYNEFHSGLLYDLKSAFGNDGIQVTPAREYSVAVYLHIPDHDGLRQRVESFVRERFNADNVDWVDTETLRVWWD